ncbi:MAG: TatD family hydrolase [Raineya sp.]|jgi:TatD DNase family protein|nr:TatD family hydrolase [Raineya sp.]
MIIDTHCHIDLYENPKKILLECEKENITVLAMTNLPSHFEMGYSFFKQQKRIRIALGMHPLYSARHEEELPWFFKNIHKTSYLGEVGLDFSKDGYHTKDTQIKTFIKILNSISSQKKILSIHSRKAEDEVLELLIENKIQNAIFHWYSGPTSLISKILDAGYYFSVNPSMINSENGKKIISMIPIYRLLTESDGPFINFKNRVVHPRDIKDVINYISTIQNKKKIEVEVQIQKNFNELIQKIM